MEKFAACKRLRNSLISWEQRLDHGGFVPSKRARSRRPVTAFRSLPHAPPVRPEPVRSRPRGERSL